MQCITYQNNSRTINCLSSFSLETPSDTTPKVFTTLVTHISKSLSSSNPPVLSETASLFLLDYHVDRLLNSAKTLGIIEQASIETFKNESIASNSYNIYDAQWIANEVVNTVSCFYQEPALRTVRLLLRLVLAPNKLDIVVDWYIAPWPPESPIDAISVSGIRPASAHKTTHIETSVLARKRAHQRHAQEAILIDENSFVKEGAWSNLFWVDQEGMLCTTDSDILPGVTRRIIMEKIPVKISNISLPDLIKTATEVFITQSTTGITPVATIDGKRIGSERPGPVTMKLSALYNNWVNDLAIPIPQAQDTSIELSAHRLLQDCPPCICDRP